MDKNEIKKALYKQNPIANFKFIRKGVAYYWTIIASDKEPIEITFEIPVLDMGDADFEQIMQAKLLIRWIS